MANCHHGTSNNSLHVVAVAVLHFGKTSAHLHTVQADDREFMDWEQKTAIKRSEHTFFQNLYRIKQDLPGAKASTAVNTEVLAVGSAAKCHIQFKAL